MKYRHLIHLLFFLCVPGFVLAAPPAAEPEIVSVEMQETNVVITVAVEAGYARLVYETKRDLKRAREAWVPRHSQAMSGDAETLEVVVPIDPAHGCFRIRVYPDALVDRSLYEGTNAFAPQPEGEGTSDQTPGRSAGLEVSGNGAPVADNAGGNGGGATVEAVDSDVWAIKGDRLYFFNRYRGLQIIDVSIADAPVLLDTLAFAANGERMFVLPDSDHVVLIASGWCNNSGSENTQDVVIIDVSGDQARILHRMSVPGYIRESRLVGTSLFTGSNGYFEVTPADEEHHAVYESRTYLTSFDLSDPNNARQADQLHFPGYGGAVRAFPTHIALVTHHWQNGRNTGVTLVEIDHTTGAMNLVLELDAGGRVRNEYLLDVRDNVLSVIVDDTSQTISRLTNYDFSGTPLGQVEVGQDERLFSARFDGTTVYAVTFRRIDPLWIIDNSDPSDPQVKGEIEVPGFSTYIEPLDGQVLTIGTVSGQVAVSLFDTSDLTAPALLSRIAIGERYSWSEAQYEEQAFQVEKDAGLVMVPFYSAGASGLQLIELGNTNLVERGIVPTPSSVRRSAVKDTHILAVTGTDLLVIDPADLEQPRLTAQLELARQVSRVFTHNGHLVEIDAGQSYFWGGGTPEQARLRTRTIDNDTPLAELDLEAMPVIGAEQHGDLLYLLQADNSGGFYCCWLADGQQPDEAPPPSNIVCTVIDLSGLPDLRIAGQDVTLAKERPYGNMQALWPEDDVLVWAPANSSWPIFVFHSRGVGGLFASDALFYPYYQSPSRLVTYELPDAESPVFASNISLSNSNAYYQAGVYDAADGKIFTGHDSWEFVPSTNEVKEGELVLHNRGRWYSHQRLDVIDFLDPANPVLRPPAELEGRFAGVSESGRIVYTTEDGRYDSNTQSWSTNQLHAFGYDDVRLFHLASLAVGESSGSGTPLVQNNVLYLRANFSSTNELWTCALDDNHQWVIHQRDPDPGWSTLYLKNDVLIAHRYSNSTFYDLASPRSPQLLNARRQSESCTYANPTFGDGRVSTGLFMPNGLYGIDRWVFE